MNFDLIISCILVVIACILWGGMYFVVLKCSMSLNDRQNNNENLQPKVEFDLIDSFSNSNKKSIRILGMIIFTIIALTPIYLVLNMDTNSISPNGVRNIMMPGILKILQPIIKYIYFPPVTLFCIIEWLKILFIKNKVTTKIDKEE